MTVSGTGGGVMLDFSARWGEGGGSDMGNIDGMLTLGNIRGAGDDPGGVKNGDLCCSRDACRLY